MLPCFNTLIVCLLHELLNVQVSLHPFSVLKRSCSYACFTDALYENKQTIMSKEREIARLQAQVEPRTAEKDTVTAKYEAIVKESEGENIA